MYEYLCGQVKTVIQKLCLTYAEVANNNTHIILMVWLNLFGMVYRSTDRSPTA